MSRGIPLEHFEPGQLPRHPGVFALPNFLKPDPVEIEVTPKVPDPAEIEKAEKALETERAAKQHIVSTFETLLSEIEQRWIGDVEREIAGLRHCSKSSLESLLPNLLDEFGAAQIAAAVLAIVEMAKLQTPTLELAEEDFDDVVAELSDRGIQTRIEIRKSTERKARSAALCWDHGGADLDLDDFLSNARAVLQQEAKRIPNGEQ